MTTPAETDLLQGCAKLVAVTLKQLCNDALRQSVKCMRPYSDKAHIPPH